MKYTNKTQSPFEKVYSFSLNTIWLFYRVTKLPRYSTNKQIILCFHSVGNTSWRFSTPVSVFARQVAFLKKHYKVVKLSDLVEKKTSGVAITFDDGYADVLENAFPLLKKYGLPATMFALGNGKKANRKELDNQLPIMSDSDIKKLYKLGWEIGYHTTTHANLAELAQKQLHDEIIKGKKEAEKRLGFRIPYFAYPRGIYTSVAVSYLKKAKFQKAFTINGGTMGNTSPFLLHRVPMEGNITDKQFEALLSPLGLQASKFLMGLLLVKEKIRKLRV